jgi:hypothetical protein
LKGEKNEGGWAGSAAEIKLNIIRTTRYPLRCNQYLGVSDWGLRYL